MAVVSIANKLLNSIDDQEKAYEKIKYDFQRLVMLEQANIAIDSWLYEKNFNKFQMDYQDLVALPIYWDPFLAKTYLKPKKDYEGMEDFFDILFGSEYCERKALFHYYLSLCFEQKRQEKNFSLPNDFILFSILQKNIMILYDRLLMDEPDLANDRMRVLFYCPELMSSFAENYGNVPEFFNYHKYLPDISPTDYMLFSIDFFMHFIDRFLNQYYKEQPKKCRLLLKACISFLPPEYSQDLLRHRDIPEDLKEVIREVLAILPSGKSRRKCYQKN